jgi:hypothetical protein
MDRLKEYADKNEKALENDGLADWMIPEHNGWTGALFLIESLKKPFDREEHHKDIVTAISDPESPGTAGDLAAIQLQGDWLAAMERAFRERHKSSLRCMIQASARQKGHNKKVYEKMLTGYIQRLLSKGAGGS